MILLLIMGYLYRIDLNGNRVTDSIRAEFSNECGQLYFKSNRFSEIGLNSRHLRFHYSDDDLPINGDYEIEEVCSDQDRKSVV